MSHFVTDLDSRDIDEVAGLFQLLAPLVYCSDLLHEMIIVPEGFVSDGASVPRLPFAYMVVGGKGKRAAVVHDWAYSGGLPVSREVADNVFAEALRSCGYNALVVGLMFAGVRLGGWWGWGLPNQPQPAHVAAQMEAP